mmetsp:Transcript_2756/g.6150  ORF Transcript_2756/g.6150 Transcript_2756/m.6150 type:complete len:210 (-) Transcript_2756:808-1437(-)
MSDITCHMVTEEDHDKSANVSNFSVRTQVTISEQDSISKQNTATPTTLDSAFAQEQSTPIKSHTPVDVPKSLNHSVGAPSASANNIPDNLVAAERRLNKKYLQASSTYSASDSANRQEINDEDQDVAILDNNNALQHEQLNPFTCDVSSITTVDFSADADDNAPSLVTPITSTQNTVTSTKVNVNDSLKRSTQEKVSDKDALILNSDNR